MPLNFLRGLTSPLRTEATNRQLGCALAFVAGAANAGGFLAVGQYTSHMSGLVSSVADNVVLGEGKLVLAAIAAVFSFAVGAVTSTILINWGRLRYSQSMYAVPLLVEAILLLLFGGLGTSLVHHQFGFIPVTVALLCFVMGLQNAMITKISNSEIRTTHVTGLVTDIGIELGRALYWNRGIQPGDARFVRASHSRLVLLSSLLTMFVIGGFFGAITFKHLGYVATVPIASLLFVFALVPIADDISAARRRRGRK